MKATVHDDSVRVVCPRDGTTLEFKRHGDMDCAKQPQYLGGVLSTSLGEEQCCDVCPFLKKARKAAIQALDLNHWGTK